MLRFDEWHKIVLFIFIKKMTIFIQLKGLTVHVFLKVDLNETSKSVYVNVHLYRLVSKY